MSRIKDALKIARSINAKEEGDGVAWGGGGLLTIILVVVLLIIIF